MNAQEKIAKLINDEVEQIRKEADEKIKKIVLNSLKISDFEEKFMVAEGLIRGIVEEVGLAEKYSEDKLCFDCDFSTKTHDRIWKVINEYIIELPFTFCCQPSELKQGLIKYIVRKTMEGSIE